MLRVLCNAVCWRRAPHIGQACLFPPSALFANMNPAPLEGHAHASKSSQDTHLGSQAQWSRSRCSFPDRTGRPPSRRSQRPSVCLHESRAQKDHGTVDALYPLISHIQTRKLEGRVVYCAILDFETVYSSVSRPQLYTYLHEQGIQGQMLAVIKSFTKSRGGDRYNQRRS